MLREKFSTSFSVARIEVQQPFCNNCSIIIKKKLASVKGIENLQLYPSDSLVAFNFKRASHLSNLLNLLTEMGYPQKGEKLFEKDNTNAVCNC